MPTPWLDADFYLDFKVRDYECDMQGIVNNAVYLHYLEHTRHEFLQHRGLSFANMTATGINLVIRRMELDYLSSLRSGDTFIVTLTIKRLSLLRIGFSQCLYHASDARCILRAEVVVTGVNQAGKILLPEELLAIIPSAN